MPDGDLLGLRARQPPRLAAPQGETPGFTKTVYELLIAEPASADTVFMGPG